MHPDSLLKLLKQVETGEVSAQQAQERLSTLPFEDLGFARIDHHRSLRTGMPEVVFAAGKTPEQTAMILERIAASGVPALATRATPAHFAAAVEMLPGARYHAAARCIVVGEAPLECKGKVAVLCAGTSDLPVAEEAAITAETFGAEVDRITDVGVAGLHRLLAAVPRIRTADVLVVCAGMEGALTSVVAGLVDVPVIAVPTSVGYGTNFGGLTALLGMLNSCSPTVTVVNIDNGFGGGFNAARIARLAAAKQE
ncbi:MAG: nickel pincer cofactor biosynthesis protein LarB [Acidobacteriaceae bacterium]|nr:nickel pincer cofactor biosynthesis protein LarB [Acidobacteriaceae bacterium]